MMMGIEKRGCIDLDLLDKARWEAIIEKPIIIPSSLSSKEILKTSITRTNSIPVRLMTSLSILLVLYLPRKPGFLKWRSGSISDERKRSSKLFFVWLPKAENNGKPADHQMIRTLKMDGQADKEIEATEF